MKIGALPARKARKRKGRRSSSPKRQLLLGLGALGVVFGDIGTSPLYAFQSVFGGAHHVPVVELRVMGAASLIFWTLTIVVSIKFVMIVMRADNKGEGGVIALAALAVQFGVRTKRGRVIVMGLGILGGALFYGDGMITPAISVLSAVQGLEVTAPTLSSLIVPISIVVLVALFLAQQFGTGRVGLAFGPIMFVWFVVIAVLGLISLVQTPQVLAAVSPTYAVSFFIGEPALAFLSLGAVVLCVTGAEALHADMGQFGRSPITISWFAVVTPALYLNYFGQAALVVREPASAANPFYLMVPGPLQWPTVLLATVATIIASQAVISGTFSMTRQAISLDYLPRMTTLHTSAAQRGQVYVPAVNWILMAAVIVLVVGFRSSDTLASAYGIAVTGTFVITTILMIIIALHQWKLSPWIVWPVATFLMIIDVAFFLANLTKLISGGWLPLAVAAVVYWLLMTWRRGQEMLAGRIDRLSMPLKDLELEVQHDHVTRVPGTAIYVAVHADSAPFAMVRHATLLQFVAATSVIVHFETTDQPHVEPRGSVSINTSAPGFVEVMARVGFMDRPRMSDALRHLADHGVKLSAKTTTYIIGRVNVKPYRKAAMWYPRQLVYVSMTRRATHLSDYLDLPLDRVVEINTLVRL